MELIHFSALLKQHLCNNKDSIEIQTLKFINKNGLMSAFPKVSAVSKMYLCLMISNCSGERSF